MSDFIYMLEAVDRAKQRKIKPKKYRRLRKRIFANLTEDQKKTVTNYESMVGIHGDGYARL